MYKYYKVSLFYLFMVVSFFSFTLSSLYALTMEEAVILAGNNYPLLKAQIETKEQAKYLKKASYDLYYPTLSLSYAYRDAFDTSIDATYQKIWDTQYSSSVGLSYRLFDGGYRSSIGKQASFVFNQSISDIAIQENDLSLMVKKSFYTIMASKAVLEVQEDAEIIAKKNYEMAKAKRETGVAKFSDVTQAQVRYTQAKMSTIAAGKDLEKAISALNSLIGWPLNKKIEIDGEFTTFPIKFDVLYLQKIALLKRPEIEKQALNIDISAQSIKAERSNYWPKIDLQLLYQRYDETGSLNEHEAVFYTALSYDLFNGPGRYYKVSAQKKAQRAEIERLSEVKRIVSLEVNYAYKDMELAYANYQVALDLVEAGQVNYEQAFGEYRVGKGDILTLIQADMNLSESKIGLIQQKINYNVSISSLEKAVFMDLNDLQKNEQEEITPGGIN